MDKNTKIEFEFTPRPTDVLKATYLLFLVKPQKLILIIFLSTILTYLILKLNYNTFPLPIIVIMGLFESLLILIIVPLFSLIINRKFLLQSVKVSFEKDGFRSVKNNIETFYKYSGIKEYKVVGSIVFITFKALRITGWLPLIGDSDALLALLKEKIGN